MWAIVDEGLNSLLGFRRQIHWRSKRGAHGQGSNCTGACGEDLYIPVPPGTIIRMKDAQEGSPPLAELTKPGMSSSAPEFDYLSHANIAVTTCCINLQILLCLFGCPLCKHCLAWVVIIFLPVVCF